jgi:hypothetical protein
MAFDSRPMHQIYRSHAKLVPSPTLGGQPGNLYNNDPKEHPLELIMEAHRAEIMIET